MTTGTAFKIDFGQRKRESFRKLPKSRCDRDWTKVKAGMKSITEGKTVSCNWLQKRRDKMWSLMGKKLRYNDTDTGNLTKLKVDLDITYL